MVSAKRKILMKNDSNQPKPNKENEGQYNNENYTANYTANYTTNYTKRKISMKNDSNQHKPNKEDEGL